MNTCKIYKHGWRATGGGKRCREEKVEEGRELYGCST